MKDKDFLEVKVNPPGKKLILTEEEYRARKELIDQFVKDNKIERLPPSNKGMEQIYTTRTGGLVHELTDPVWNREPDYGFN